MKRPLYDMIDRQEMIENNSFYALRMHLAMNQLRFKREIGRILEPIFLPIIEWLAKQLNKL